VNQTTSDLDSPTHAARKIFDGLVSPLCQFDSFQQFSHEPATTFPWNSVQLGINQKIFFDTQLEIARHCLRNHTNHSPYRISFLYNIVPANRRRPSCRGDQRGQHPDERGFPGAIRPQQRKDFTVLNRKRNAIDGGEIAEFFCDLLYFDICHRSPAS
jgi:hypothetical protein